MPDKTNDLFATLTEQSLATSDIAKVNFARVSAKLAPNGGDTRITLEYGDGLIDGGFLLTQAPPDDCLTVRRAVLDILSETNLQELCTNLEASAALIDVAYNACNSITGAHENLYQLRTDINNAVADSVVLADLFKRATTSVMKSILSVYRSLSSSNEYEARDAGIYLSSIAKAGEGLSKEAEEMSARFVVLRNKALAEGKNIVVLEGTTLKQRDEMQKQLADFNAQIEAFNSTKQQLKRQIAQAQALYTKYDDEARNLHDKADTYEIIGTVVGGLGQIAGCVSSAVAGYYGAMTPKINIGSAPAASQNPTAATSAAGKPKGNGSATDSANSASSAENSSDVVARQTRIGSNKAELALIDARLPEYTTKLATLEAEKKSSDKTRTDSEIDAEMKTTKDKQSTDSKRKIDIEKEIANDESYLRARMSSSIGTSVSETAKDLEQRMDKVGNNARSAAAAKDTIAQSMLTLKFELEEKEAENLATIAEFTQRIKNSNVDIIDTSVIINSLQLAITCLSTVGSILTDVALFWTSIKNTCRELASEKVIETLNTAIDRDASNAEKLAGYVTRNSTFALNWFIMTSKWSAMYLVCNAYYESSINAKKTLSISLHRAETSGREHGLIAQELAKDLEAKLEVNLRCSQSKDADFKKRVEWAQKENDNLLLEF